MADTIPTTPQNPFAAPGSDPNADLFNGARAAGTATVTAPSGQFFSVPPTSSVVSSSTPASNYVGNLGNTIAQGQTNPPTIPTPGNPTGAPLATSPGGATGATPYDPSSDPAVQDAITSANKPLQDRLTALEQERQAEIARLTQESSKAQTDLGNSQKAETGTSNRNLTYLQQGGQSASAQAYLNSLEQTHQTEMSTLVAKYTSAIQAANNAYNDKDFQLAQEMAKSAANIKKEAQARNQDFLDYTLKVRQQINDEAKLQYDMQAEQRKQAADVVTFARDNGLHPDAAFFAVGGNIFDSRTGRAFDSKEAALAAGVKADLSNVQMIQKPQDGKKYSPGIIGEYEKYQEDVAAGKAKPLTFNQYADLDANRKIRVGRASAGTSPVDVREAKATQLENDMDQKLQARVGANDKYISPEDWAYYRNLWMQAGGAAADFAKKFVHYANPGTDNNPLLKNYIGLQ